MTTGSGTRKKSNSSKKTSQGTRKNTKTNSVKYNDRPRTEQERMISNEISLLVLLAVAVLLFLCNFGIIGPVGNAISGFMFGIFGLLAYIAPVFIFLAAAFGVSNRGNRAAIVKMSAAIVLFFLIGMTLHLFQGDMDTMTGYSISHLYELGKNSKLGGGVLFGSLAYILYSLLDTIGSVLVLLLLFIACIVIITEKSFVNSVKKGSHYVVSSARDDARYRREKAQKRREELEMQKQQRLEERSRIEKKEQEEKSKEEAEKILRMDRKVTGVMMDTRLKKEPAVETTGCRHENIHEITVNDFEQPVTYDQKVNSNGDINYNQSAVRNQEIIHKQKIAQPVEPEFDFNNIKIHGVHQIEINEAQDVSAAKSVSGAMTEIFPRETYESEEYVTDNTIEEIAATERFQESASYVPGMSMEEIYPAPQPEYKPVIAASDSEKENDPVAKTEENASSMIKKRPAAKVKEVSEKDRILQAAGQNINPITKPEQPAKPYQFPPISFLKKTAPNKNGNAANQLKETAMRLQQTLATFGVKVTITDISQGPAVTRYELQPEQGVKVSKIVGLTDDIKLNLAATDIRMEAPIPGKAAIGIEVPNKENASVGLRDLLESKEYKEFPSKIAFAVGKDIAGKVVVADIARMPHMLIAGSTGSGKSVCINTLIMSILYKANPEEVKLIMIDPKVVELSVYNGIPHLLIPVVTDPKKAAAALHWGVAEMSDRYQKFADFNVRDLKGYNAEVEKRIARGETDVPKKMPQIVIIVDELADLMMVAPGEVEESICRLAQLARACGIHLIIATQRPSVDVITGLIKANMPSRVAFAVSSGVDSRTILDMNGAEKLLGKGDMLFYPQGYPKPARIQGAFVSDQEVGDVVDFLKNQTLGNVYNEDIEDKIKNIGSASSGGSGGGGSQKDDYFIDAAKFIIEKDKASIGMLQRVFKIGFNRAARIMDQLADAGVVGEEEGTKPRKVLMSMEQFESYVEESL